MTFLDKLRPSKAPAGDLVTDPVCGMRISPADAAGTSVHAGRTIHFCSASCKRKFDADPAFYAARLA